MLTEPTMEKLRTLKLYGMLTALELQMSSSEYKDLTFEERLGLLVDREVLDRANRRRRARSEPLRVSRRPGCLGWAVMAESFSAIGTFLGCSAVSPSRRGC